MGIKEWWRGRPHLPTMRRMLGFDTEQGRKRWDDKLAVVIGLVAITLILITVAGATLMVISIFQHPTPSVHVSVFSEIFASRMMLAATRMAILFVGLYVVLSMLMHMRKGMWLTAAGPFKVQEAVATVTRSAVAHDARMALLQRERDLMRRRASELNDELRRMEQLLARAQGQLRELGADEEK